MQNEMEKNTIDGEEQLRKFLEENPAAKKAYDLQIKTANQRAKTAEKKLEGLRWVKNAMLFMHAIEIMEERKLMETWKCKRCLLQSNAMQ